MVLSRADIDAQKRNVATVMRIGELAERAGVSVRSLRYYRSRG
jgi:MerR family regulatory protein